MIVFSNLYGGRKHGKRVISFQVCLKKYYTPERNTRFIRLTRKWSCNVYKLKDGTIYYLHRLEDRWSSSREIEHWHENDIKSRVPGMLRYIPNN